MTIGGNSLGQISRVNQKFEWAIGFLGVDWQPTVLSYKYSKTSFTEVIYEYAFQRKLDYD